MQQEIGWLVGVPASQAVRPAARLQHNATPTHPPTHSIIPCTITHEPTLLSRSMSTSGATGDLRSADLKMERREPSSVSKWVGWGGWGGRECSVSLEA